MYVYVLNSRQIEFICIIPANSGWIRVIANNENPKKLYIKADVGNQKRGTELVLNSVPFVFRLYLLYISSRFFKTTGFFK